MVSIRYHIVTLVAVFLALGIGVAVGSTVIDKALVGDLENRVDSLENRLSDARTESDTMRRQLDDLTHRDDELDAEGPEALLAGTLDGVSVLVVAAQGIDEGPIDKLHAAVEAAGGSYQGTVWVTARLALSDDDAVAALADLVGSASTEPAALRQRLEEQLAARVWAASGNGPAVDGLGDGTAAGASLGLDALLEDLADARFIRLADRPGSNERDLAGVRLVVVSGAGAELADDAFLQPFVAAVAAGGPAPLVAAEAAPAPGGAGPQGGTTTTLAPPEAGFVRHVRDDAALRERVSTVDDLEVFEGRAATVLALKGLARGAVGHYGTGDGADALLPTP